MREPSGDRGKTVQFESSSWEGCVKSAQETTPADSRNLSRFPFGFIVACFLHVPGTWPRASLASVCALPIVHVHSRQRANTRPGTSRLRPPQCKDPSVQSHQGSSCRSGDWLTRNFNLWPIPRLPETSGGFQRCPDGSFVACGENARTQSHRARRGNAGRRSR